MIKIRFFRSGVTIRSAIPGRSVLKPVPLSQIVGIDVSRAVAIVLFSPLLLKVLGHQFGMLLFNSFDANDRSSDAQGNTHRERSENREVGNSYLNVFS